MSKRKTYNVAADGTELQPMNEKGEDGKDNSSLSQVRDSDKVELKRNLTLFNGIGIIVGSIIGSGIFLNPSGLYNATQNPYGALLVWTGCGIFSIIGAISFAELGTCITKSGGDYAYIMAAFGPLPAFVYLFVTVVVMRPATAAILAMTFAKYVIKPAIPFDSSDGACSLKAEILLATVAIGLLTAINCISVKLSTKIQDIFTAAKLLALAIIIVTGFAYLIEKSMSDEGKEELATNIFNANDKAEFKKPFAVTGIAIAAYEGLFAYSGWNYLNYITAELQDPYVNLPRAIYIGLPLVMVAYVLTNAAYFLVLTPNELIEAITVAATFGEKTFPSYIQWLMPLCVAMSTFGGANGTLFTTSRMFFAGAEEGHMPEIMSCVHLKRFTPVPALIFTGALSVVYILVGNIGTLLNYVSFILWVSTGISVAALIRLRYTHPDMPRPIKVSLFYPITYIILTTMLIICAVYEQPVDSAYGALITGCGIPIYMIFIWWPQRARAKKPVGRSDSSDSCMAGCASVVTSFFQKVFCVMPQEKSEAQL